MTPIEAAAQFAADNPQAAATLRAEGGAAERSRIKGVREQLMPGHEALIEQLAADGATTPEQAAMAVNAAERARLSAMASARAADAPAPVAEPAVERAAPARQPTEQPHARRLAGHQSRRQHHRIHRQDRTRPGYSHRALADRRR